MYHLKVVVVGLIVLSDAVTRDRRVVLLSR